MHNLKSVLKNSIKTLSVFWKITPVSLIVVLVYFAFTGIYPAIYTVVSNRAFAAIDTIAFKDGAKEYLFINLLMLIGLFVVRNILEMLVDIPRSCFIYSKAKTILNMRLSVRTANEPFINFENAELYDNLTRAKQCVSGNKLQKLLFNILTTIFTAIGIMGTMGVLYSFNKLLPFVLVLSTIPFVVVVRIRGFEYYEIQYKQIPLKRMKDYLWNLFFNKTATKELRLFKSQDYIYEKWAKTRDTVCNEEKKYVKKESRSILLCNVFQIVGVFVGILLSLLLVRLGQVSVGQFIAVINSFFVIQISLCELMNSFSGVFSSNRYVNDYFSYVDESNFGNQEEKKKIKGIDTITFNNVNFRYPNQTDLALSNVNFSISNGEKIVIVGENGSGKTTMVKAILGLLPPLDGSIKINDCNISDIDLECFYKYCSIVSQDFTKYNLSLFENISLSEDYDTSKILNALKDLNVKIGCEVETDVLLGKEFGGKELSGGEWQKIAIARGLYKNSHLIILDEPTASLDPVVENEILTNFVNISNNKTAIIVTHRVGLCSIADRVFVMKDGVLIAQGTHDYLLSNCEYYKNFYIAQQQWYK